MEMCRLAKFYKYLYSSEESLANQKSNEKKSTNYNKILLTRLDIPSSGSIVKNTEILCEIRRIARLTKSKFGQNYLYLDLPVGS